MIDVHNLAAVVQIKLGVLVEVATYMAFHWTFL
jgi:hypothetical protein